MKRYSAGSRPCLTEQGVNLKGCETLSPTDVSDRLTLGSDFGSRNRAVGRPDGHFGEVVFPVLWHKRSKTGRRGVSEESG